MNDTDATLLAADAAMQAGIAEIKQLRARVAEQETAITQLMVRLATEKHRNAELTQKLDDLLDAPIDGGINTSDAIVAAKELLARHAS